MSKKPIEKEERLAERLKMARKMAGLTQSQVAKIMNLHRPTISEIEAGRRRVSASEIPKFADTYGVSTAWLLGNDIDESSDLNDRVKLAAREINKLNETDLERLLNLLSALRRGTD